MWRAAAADLLDRAFSGFSALPPVGTPVTTNRPPWADTLDVSPAASLEELRSAYREKARVRHPDSGGSDAAMQDLNIAYETALNAYKARNVA